MPDAVSGRFGWRWGQRSAGLCGGGGGLITFWTRKVSISAHHGSPSLADHRECADALVLTQMCPACRLTRERDNPNAMGLCCGSPAFPQTANRISSASASASFSSRASASSQPSRPGLSFFFFPRFGMPDRGRSQGYPQSTMHPAAGPSSSSPSVGPP